MPTQRITGNRIQPNSIPDTDLVSVANTKIVGTLTDSQIESIASTKITGVLTPAQAPAFASGTVMLFRQTAAPTGWTKDTTHNDKALRVVSGSVGSGGNTTFSATFVNRTPTGSVSGTNSGGAVSDAGLAVSQLASHAHTEQLMSSVATMTTTGTRIGGSGSGTTNRTATSDTQTSGSGVAHGHGFTQPSWSGSFTGTALDMGVQYVDVIIATKD